MAQAGGSDRAMKCATQRPSRREVLRGIGLGGVLLATGACAPPCGGGRALREPRPERSSTCSLVRMPRARWTEVFAHHATMRGLAPDTAYVYEVLHDGAVQIVGHFVTAPAGRAHLRFTSFGDQSTPSRVSGRADAPRRSDPRRPCR
jgi:hypothetical protein